jgi:hypothetical protein
MKTFKLSNVTLAMVLNFLVLTATAFSTSLEESDERYSVIRDTLTHYFQSSLENASQTTDSNKKIQDLTEAIATNLKNRSDSDVEKFYDRVQALIAWRFNEMSESSIETNQNFKDTQYNLITIAFLSMNVPQGDQIFEKISSKKIDNELQLQKVLKELKSLYDKNLQERLLRVENEKSRIGYPTSN